MADQNPPAAPNDPAATQQQQGSTVTIEPQAGRVPLDANAGQIGRNVENANLPASPNPATLAAPALAPSPGLSPSHYSKGRITRAGIEHVIRGGGSVVHNGKSISTLAGIPSELQLAQDYNLMRERELANMQAAIDAETDPGRKRQLQANLETARRERLTDQSVSLDDAEADLDRREQSLAAERSRLATARRQADQRQPQQQTPQSAADALPKGGKGK